MKQFLDIGSLIEQTVQEALGENSQASSVPAVDAAPALAPVAEKKGPQYLRVSRERGEHPGTLSLVEDNRTLRSEPVPAPAPSRPMHRGSFAAKLWSGPAFFSQQILKSKVRTA